MKLLLESLPSSTAQSAYFAALILFEVLSRNQSPPHGSKAVALELKKIVENPDLLRNEHDQEYLRALKHNVNEAINDLYVKLKIDILNWLKVCPEIVSNSYSLNLTGFTRLPPDIWQNIFLFLTRSDLAYLELSNRFFRLEVSAFKQTTGYKKLPLTQGHSALPYTIRRYIYDPRFIEEKGYRESVGCKNVPKNLLLKIAENEGEHNRLFHCRTHRVDFVLEMRKSKELITACHENKERRYKINVNTQVSKDAINLGNLQFFVKGFRLSGRLILTYHIETHGFSFEEHHDDGCVVKQKISPIDNFPNSPISFIALIRADELLLGTSSAAVLFKKNKQHEYELIQRLINSHQIHNLNDALAMNELELIIIRTDSVQYYRRNSNEPFKLIQAIDFNLQICNWCLLNNSDLVFTCANTATQIWTQDENKLFSIKQEIDHRTSVVHFYRPLQSNDLLIAVSGTLSVWRKNASSQFERIQQLGPINCSFNCIQLQTAEVIVGRRDQGVEVYKQNSDGLLQHQASIPYLSMNSATLLSDGRLLVVSQNSLNFISFTSLITKLRTLTRQKPNALSLLREIQNAILFDLTKGRPNTWNVGFWNGTRIELNDTKQTLRIPDVMKEILDCITEYKQKVQKTLPNKEEERSAIYREALQAIAIILMQPRCQNYPEPRARASMYIWLRKIIDSRLIFQPIDNDESNDMLEIAACSWRRLDF